MITNQLLRPASIVVVGASNNVHKPGGAILRNLINGGYTGELRAVNPQRDRSTRCNSLCRCEGYSRYGYGYTCHSGTDVSGCCGGACC